MDINTVMQYGSYLLIAIGVMAFIVSAITQVIKSWPGLDKLPTSAGVIVLSLVLCPLTLVMIMAYLNQPMVYDCGLCHSGFSGGTCSYGRLGKNIGNMAAHKI